MWDLFTKKNIRWQSGSQAIQEHTKGPSRGDVSQNPNAQRDSAKSLKFPDFKNAVKFETRERKVSWTHNMTIEIVLTLQQ